MGLHDTLRNGPRSLANEVKGGSVIQQRLTQWEETQDSLKMTMQRNLFGLHLPVRQMMERKAVAANPHMPALAQTQSNIHLDILMGRDETLDVADVFGDQETSAPLDIHSEMERKRHI
ncbi:proteasome maturation factor UMP1 [Gautieria morchelliformis]|nr:proteasome maturation factor UMP1 [Gautieria morchelliformis]